MFFAGGMMFVVKKKIQEAFLKTINILLKQIKYFYINVKMNGKPLKGFVL